MSGRLLAISDLHVRHRGNRAALDRLAGTPDDWLILAGDLGETEEHLRTVFEVLGPKFGRLLWVPGNHELWSTKHSPLQGPERYDALVALCREHGVVTPEDPYPVWEGAGGPAHVCPMFLLYDYSFGPEGSTKAEALAWAAEQGLVCSDEFRLKPGTAKTREAWCQQRLDATAARLEQLDPALPTVLINHWQLRRELVRIPRIARFVIWCGTEQTADWHTRFRAKVVVSGHLHLRTTDWIDGTRFEEVSLGYPRHWRTEADPMRYVREILPGPAEGPAGGFGGPIFHR